jgi:hypothetical protein
MSDYTPAQLAAMRKRWARRRAARLAKPAPDISPDELHARAVADCERRKSSALSMAAHHRQKQSEAKAAGDAEIARSLGMLAVYFEQSAALAEAERRDRIARFQRLSRAERNRTQARRPRPGRSSPLRDAILHTLAPLKCEGVAFRDVMRRWRMERIGSLRLADLGAGRFRVTDENGCSSDATTYTRGTLERLYSESRQVLTASTG